MKISKRFLWGFVTGAFFLMLAAAIVLPQYSDYLAKTQVARWLGSLLPDLMEEIEENHLNHAPLNKVGTFDLEHFHKAGGRVFEVTKSGIIILRGGKEGQLVIVWPSFSETGTRWRCMGGPIEIASSCNRIEKSNPKPGKGRP